MTELSFEEQDLIIDKLIEKINTDNSVEVVLDLSSNSGRL